MASIASNPRSLASHHLPPPATTLTLSSGRPHPLQIPEILAMITSYLQDQQQYKTALSLVQVCKIFRQSFLPLLWEDMDFQCNRSTPWHGRIPHQDVVTHKGFVRHLRFSWYNQFHFDKIHYPGLTTLFRSLLVSVPGSFL